MRRALLVALLVLAVGAPVTYAAAPRLFQGWTGGTDVTSNGGSLTLSQGGALFVDGGCADLQDTFAAPGPTHSVTVCNWGIGLTKYGSPNVSAYIVTGSSDPTLGTDNIDPAASIYLRHKLDGTGELWFKTCDADSCWVKVAG